MKIINTLFPTDTQGGVIVPILGIIPLLMVADTVEKGTVIGVINLLVLIIVGLIVSSIRNLLPVETRMTAILMISATVVSLMLLFLQLWFFDFSQKLGIYIPLIAVSCLVLVRAEEYALRNRVINSVIDTFMAGTGILLVLISLAFVREYSGLTLLKQPAGAFLLLGLLTSLCSSADIGKKRNGLL